jgi:hypothetical protein
MTRTPLAEVCFRVLVRRKELLYTDMERSCESWGASEEVHYLCLDEAFLGTLKVNPSQRRPDSRMTTAPSLALVILFETARTDCNFRNGSFPENDDGFARP